VGRSTRRRRARLPENEERAQSARHRLLQLLEGASSVWRRSSEQAAAPRPTPQTPESVAHVTGVDPRLVRRLACDYAKADRAMLCWTLGITEHHNAVDDVLSLIDLALATGHVGRWGSGLDPVRGQNNVQGGGDMGASGAGRFLRRPACT
jgi:anaerobic selenocysteine-containing dehydrogenase